MSCPYGYGVKFEGGASIDATELVQRRLAELNSSRENKSVDNGKSDRVNEAVFSDQINYGEYLQLNKLLSCQRVRSAESNQLVPDEHLFIIIHQAYELWFKQMIFDIDNVRKLLHNKIVDETKSLQIVNLLERTGRILHLMVDQILILETMSPLDFVEFRKYLTSASGFQSLQFRLLENKLGVICENRVRYNTQHYQEAFIDESDRKQLIASEEEPSLFVLIDRWLARTPGIYEMEESDIPASHVVADDDINSADSQSESGKSRQSSGASSGSSTAKNRKTFWNRYLEAVSSYLEDMRSLSLDERKSPEERALIAAEYTKTCRSFNTITDEKEYQSMVDKGERRLSHNALKGALLIYFYRDMPRFHCAYMILTFLMDIDSLLQKWRYNHVILVQRMLGNRQGSGGSSGYLYLRTTIGDRYKVFLDLFNLSTWLIPRIYIPKLSPKMVKTLSEHSQLNNHCSPNGGRNSND